MSAANQTIRACVQCIRDDKLEQLIGCLGLIPLASMEKKVSDKILALFVSSAAEYSRTRCLGAVIAYFAASNPQEEKFSTLAQLLLIPTLTPKQIAFAFEQQPDKTYGEYMQELMDWDSQPEMTSACSRLDAIFGPQPEGAYRRLLENIDKQLDEQGSFNVPVRDHLRSQLNKLAKPAPVPSWVRNFLPSVPTSDDLLDQLPPDIEPVGVLPSAEEAAQLLTGGLTAIGISIEDQAATYQLVKQKYLESDEAGRRDLLEPLIRMRDKARWSKDQVVARILGPLNSMPGEPAQEGPCSLYGGCRMFTCLEFENVSEDDGVIDEDGTSRVYWFTGHCGYCQRPITKLCYAVREALPTGGWRGCYCSLKCIEDNVLEADQPAAFVRKELAQELERVGIQDRSYPDETSDSGADSD